MRNVDPGALYGRDAELLLLRRKLAARESFLLHGEAGVGKTRLLQSVLPDFSAILYTAAAKSPQSLFRLLANALLARQDDAVLSRLKRATVESKSALSLKGIVLDALRAGGYCVVLDQLQRPSQAMAAAVREIVATETPAVCVARSAHMEDAGHLLPLYPFRQERLEIKPFDLKTAALFAGEVAQRMHLEAGNGEEFLERVVAYSKGNPGIILALLGKAAQPEYLAGSHIKISPLYIDFRLEWNARR